MRRAHAPDGTTWQVRRRWRPGRGRRWAIVATSDRGEWISVEASGWQASGEELTQVVALLEAGLPVPGASVQFTVEGTGTRPAPARRWMSVIALAVWMTGLVIYIIGPRYLWSAGCPTPEVVGTEVAGPVLPARLVAAGPLSLDDAVGGKYGSDARRAAIETGSLVEARHEDWLVDEDLVTLRLLTFRDQAEALDYAAADADTICTHVDSTFSPDGLPGAAGVRQPWRSGPPGWWAGVVVDRTYARAYVRSHRDDLGASMVTDALKRAV
jgi:hypothetical protein